VLEVENLSKTYVTDAGPLRAVDGVSFAVPRGQSFSLLGASGCGKTTTLRCIAGLERPSAGVIRIDGREVFNAASGRSLPAHKRRIGMVFQSYAIWPHMTVFQNAAFPLRVAGRSASEIEDRVAWALGMVKLDGLQRRPATQLSGGQQQRLAVARALVQEPDLLLLDEPLSNLDAKLREQVRLELKSLQGRLDLTMLYVTHDQTEAIVLSDRIAVMRQGRIVEVGTPREIYQRPRSRFVADFVGSTNMFDGRVAAKLADGLYRVETPDGVLVACGTTELEPGQEVSVSVRPECIQLETRRAETTIGGNVWEVRIEGSVFLGESTYYEAARGDRMIQVRASPRLLMVRGDTGFVHISPHDCVCVPKATA
jgi:iron(III) transport system ATP-binding protein